VAVPPVRPGSPSPSELVGGLAADLQEDRGRPRSAQRRAAEAQLPAAGAMGHARLQDEDRGQPRSALRRSEEAWTPAEGLAGHDRLQDEVRQPRRWREEQLEERDMVAGRDLAATWTGLEEPAAREEHGRADEAAGFRAFAATWPPRAAESAAGHGLDGACNGGLPRTGSMPSIPLSPVERLLWASYPCKVLPAGMQPRACERDQLWMEGASFEYSGGKRWCGVARNEVSPQLSGGVAQAMDAWSSWPPAQQQKRQPPGDVGAGGRACVGEGLGAGAERRNGFASPEVDDFSQCPSCGNIYLEDANFCRICGRPRGRAEALGDPRSARCPVCWEAFTEDSRFCRRCGRARD